MINNLFSFFKVKSVSLDVNDGDILLRQAISSKEEVLLKVCSTLFSRGYVDDESGLLRSFLMKEPEILSKKSLFWYLDSSENDAIIRSGLIVLQLSKEIIWNIQKNGRNEEALLIFVLVDYEKSSNKAFAKVEKLLNEDHKALHNFYTSQNYDDFKSYFNIEQEEELISDKNLITNINATDFVSKNIVITSKNGIHVRPAAKIKRILEQNPDCLFVVTKDDKSYAVTNISSLLDLKILADDNIILNVSGENKERVLEQIHLIINGEEASIRGGADD